MEVRNGIVTRASLFAALSVVLLLWLAASWFIANRIMQRASQNLVKEESTVVERRAQNIARNVAQSITYLHGIPSLIAKDERTLRALRRPGVSSASASLAPELKKQAWSADALLLALDGHLDLVARSLGVDVLWVMNASGDSIAASNAGKPQSFVGTNYADREYFTAAMGGKLGQQYAMGRKTNIPGLFFSAPVMVDGRIVGVVTAKTDLPKLSFWVNQAEALVSDMYGVVILAKDQGLEMRALPGASVFVLSDAARMARYKRRDFPPLFIQSWGNARLSSLLRIDHDDVPSLMARRAVPGSGIEVHVLRRLPAVVAYEKERLQQFLLLAISGSVLLLMVAGTINVFLIHRDARRRMAQSLSLQRATIESTADGILVVDRDGQVTSYNQRFVDIWHVPTTLLASHNDQKLLDFVCGQMAEPKRFLVKVRELYARPDESSFDLLNFADGRTVERYSQPQRLDGEVVGRVWSFRDITERNRAEHALRIAATAFESLDGMTVTDADGRILQINRAFSELTGYAPEEVIGKTTAFLKSGRHDDEFYRQMWERLKQTGHWQGEIWNRRKNGEIFPVWLAISSVKGPDGAVTNYVGASTDITQRKASEDQIRSLAFFDPLTKLPNRRLLLDRLDHALSGSQRYARYGAVMFIDIDHFKALNDTQGHAVGDLLLVEVAQRLQASIREGDTVSRLGGDEFIIMLENLSNDRAQAAAQVEAVAEKIQAAISRPYALRCGEEQRPQDFHCTSSIGISLFMGHMETADELLKRADVAMYQAKSAGRNTVRFFDPDMQATLEIRTAMEADLRQALANREFELHYQIQVDRRQSLIGAEILLRWNSPARGLVSPVAFIPLAEETGLIAPIGLWVLQSACAQLKAWAVDPARRNLQLAVNISPRQFRQDNFISQVLEVLEQTGVNPSRLKLELTEGLVLNNVEDSIEKMHALRALGLEFSMDDFGTGYSSLSYLKKLPLSQLKIDRSFVQDLSTDANDATIVRTIITMGRTLGLEVIAEGVETEEQHEFLYQNGCSAFQGYLFGRPLPRSEFEELLDRHARSPRPEQLHA